jgi:hypothetical protein
VGRGDSSLLVLVPPIASFMLDPVPLRFPSDFGLDAFGVVMCFLSDGLFVVVLALEVVEFGFLVDGRRRRRGRRRRGRRKKRKRRRRRRRLRRWGSR